MPHPPDKLRQECGRLIQEIRREFAVPHHHPLGLNDFWWSASCYLHPKDFPPILGANLIIALNWLQQQESPEKNSYSSDLDLFLLRFDICQDPELRDPTIEIELKADYIKTEMRQSHREAYCDGYKTFAPLNKIQRGLIVRWLKLHDGSQLIYPDTLSELISCWKLFRDQQLPPPD